jgi:drug/metabolite transporter (DMT)-like permease
MSIWSRRVSAGAAFIIGIMFIVLANNPRMWLEMLSLMGAVLAFAAALSLAPGERK